PATFISANGPRQLACRTATMSTRDRLRGYLTAAGPVRGEHRGHDERRGQRDEDERHAVRRRLRDTADDRRPGKEPGVRHRRHEPDFPCPAGAVGTLPGVAGEAERERERRGEPGTGEAEPEVAEERRRNHCGTEQPGRGD